MKNMGKWFWAFVGVSVALVVAIVVAIVLGVNLGMQPGETPEGPETGLYYYDADSGEYSLTLHSGNQFTYFDGVNKVGEYTVAEDGTISFTFNKESNGTATGKYADDVLNFTYNGESMRFLRKISYTVEFNTNGGSAISKVVVANGRVVAKPDDPAKRDFVFLGWYSDLELTQPFDFKTTKITANTTLHARWTEKVDQEFTITFAGADFDTMTTVGGIVNGLPTPEKDGFTFGGWWFSFTEEEDNLAYEVKDGFILNEDVTLFALWISDSGDKLPQPIVTVNENGISWNTVAGAATYTVRITDPSGNVTTENISATTKNYNFEVAGTYVIEVCAVSAESADKNSEFTVRKYVSNALGRVSGFKVIEDTILLFDPVDGAEKYYITIVCGNSSHEHVRVDNGNSTYYNFASCEMKEGGIEFIVYAAAEGKAESESKPFAFERKLEAVTGLTVDTVTEVLSWVPVSHATSYVLNITCGEHGEHTVTVNSNSYSLKLCSGTVAVEIVPQNADYLTPAATSFSYEKDTLAAPTNIVVVGNTVSWDAVKNATSYTVKIGNWKYTVTATTIDLDTAGFDAAAGEELSITVTSKGANNVMSVESDPVTAAYMAFAGISKYEAGYAYWSPVAGATGRYEIKLNDGASVFTDGTYTTINFVKKGVNTIAVRFVGDTYTSDWDSISVMVYEVSFDSRLGSEADSIFIATGDAMILPKTVTRTGYTFDGWYNNATGTGKLYTDGAFTDAKDIVLYAKWTPNSYKITIDVEDGTTGVTDGEKFDVVFGAGFTLPVPTNDKGVFLGWFNGVDGSGVQYTDKYGKSVINYEVADNITLYPAFLAGVLTYVETDGGWAVTRGPSIYQLDEVVIPDTYKNKPIVAILENAFYSCGGIKKISFPNSVTVVGVGAFTSCYQLESIDVRKVEGVDEPLYSSYDGALMLDYFGTIYLEFFPRGRVGEYTVSDRVDSIRNKAFQSCYYVTKVNIPGNVTYVAEQAFYSCYELDEINFLEGGTEPLVIEAGAFDQMRVLETITFPSRLAQIDFETLDACPKLKTVNVGGEDGEFYGSVNGMVTNGDEDTILYCPPVVSGPVEIPVGINAIGDGAFKNRTAITSVAIPNWVSSIGANAFAGCTGLTNVAIEAPGVSGLDIKDSAFAGCTNLSSVEFNAQLTRSATGNITIGANAFAGCAKLENINFEESTISYIGEGAFSGCSRIGSVTFPATTVEVADSAFADCTGIVNVAFADEIDHIDFGNSVFAGCSKIRSVHLPASLTTFNGSVFDGCDNIREITVDPENPILLAEGGVLYSKDKSEIIYYPRALDVDFKQLPKTITKINASAFQSNTAITSVVIPGTITEIGAKAFEGCVNLASVTFAGTGDIAIGDYAFANCKALKTIAMPQGSTAISNYAFYQSNLESIKMSNVTESIGAYAFANTMLVDVTVPASVSTVGDGAFSGIATLNSFTVAAPTDGEAVALTLGSVNDTYGVFKNSKVKTVTLADRVTVIGANAFNGVTTLATVNVNATSSLKTIGEYAFASTSGLTGITLPEGLETISAYAFNKSSKMTSVTVPSTVTTIGNNAFEGCSKINSFVINDGDAPLAIGDYAFKGNTSLVTINLPARLDSIFDYVSVGTNADIAITSFYTVFEGCSKLTDINVDPACEKFGSDEGIFYVKNADGELAELIFCPKAKVNATTGEGVIKVNGKDVVPVTIPSTVTLVHNGAFVSTKLSAVIFEEKENWDGEPTLTLGTYEIQSGAITKDATSWGVFGNTNYFNLIQLPAHLKSLTSIAFVKLNNSASNGKLNLQFNTSSAPVEMCDYAMYNCGGIGGDDNGNFVLPKLSRFGSNAFNRGYSGGFKIKTLTFTSGSTVTELGESSITSNGELTAVYNIPASIETFGRFAFNSNSKLALLDFEEGSNLRTIGAYCFQSAAFTSFVCPDSVEQIGNQAFTGCSKLQSITLSPKITSGRSFDDGAIFGNLGSLREIKINGDSEHLSIKDGVLYNKEGTVLILYPAMKDIFDLSIVLGEGVTTVDDYFNGTLYEAKKADGSVVFTVKFTAETFGTDNMATKGTVLFTAADGYSTEYNYEVKVNATTKVKTVSVTEKSGSKYSAYVTETVASINLDENGVPVTARYHGAVTYDVPAGVTAIEDYAFYGYPGRELTLPEGLVRIGKYGLGGKGSTTTRLNTLTIPSTVQEIAANAFSSLSWLDTVTFAGVSQLKTLGQTAFSSCTVLDNVILPDSVVEMGNSVFNYCRGLKNVELPNGIETLPALLFSGCSSLITVTIPDSVKIIQEGLFNDCTALEIITIPASVTEIRMDYDGVFAGCTNLKAVLFEEGSKLEYLASRTFTNCTSLTSLELPASLTTLEAGLFVNCPALESITLAGLWDTVPDEMFAGMTNLTTVVFGENVKNIGNKAFYGCVKLENAILPDSLESIGTEAFSGCTALTSVNIGPAVASIGNFAFADCSALATVTFDDDSVLTSLGLYAYEESGIFKNTTSLTHIALPSSVTTIGANLFENSGLQRVELSNSIKAISDYAFYGCSSLVEVDVPANAESIGNYAFFGCTALERVNMSESVESIGSAAFRDCISLESISLSDAVSNLEGNPFVNCTNLYIDLSDNNTAFVIEDGALYTADKYTLVYYLPTNEAETFTLPEEVQIIAPGAFCCSQLVSVEIPASMKHVPDMMFMGSKKLENVVFTNKVETIGSEAFADCVSLNNVVIPNSVVEIKAKAFRGCAGLESVTFDARNTPYTIGEYAFADCTALANLELVEGFTGYTPYMLSNTGFVEYTLPEFVDNLNVEGVFSGSTKLTTFNFHENLVSLDPTGDISLGKDLFRNCTALNNVQLPECVTTLGEMTVLGEWFGGHYFSGTTVGTEYSGAFYGCTGLTSIDLSGVHNIGDYAFYGCTSLEEIIFPDEFWALGDYAFASCTGLKTVDMTNILEDAYKYGSGMIYLPDGTYQNGHYMPGNIETFCFADCTSLEYFYGPVDSYIWSIGDGFLANCTSLKVAEFTPRSFDQFDVNASPFHGLTSNTVIKLNWAAKSFWNYYSSAYDFEYNNYDNTRWYEDTEAILLGSDDKVITQSGDIVDYVPPTPTPTPTPETPKKEEA